MDAEELRRENERLKAELDQLKQLQGSNVLNDHLDKGWQSTEAGDSSGGFYIDVSALSLPKDHPDSVPNEHDLYTCTYDTVSKGAVERGYCVGLSFWTYDKSSGKPESDPAAWTWEPVFVSEKFARLMGAPSTDVATRAMKSSVNANIALRQGQLGQMKGWLRGQLTPHMTRNLVYQDNGPAVISVFWFIPCIYKAADGTVHRFGQLHYTSREETNARMYETVMHDHLGLKFTPAIISVVDQEGHFLYQNSYSAAAFGFQGKAQRPKGATPAFSLLKELFYQDALALDEMRAVTDASNMFSKVIKIRSPVLHKWLMLGQKEAKETWHQVQVSKAKDPITLQHVYIVAQLDVTSAVQTEHQVVELQAENHDLHWTRAKLEDEKAHAQEMNARLKATLVEVLAARDKTFATIIDMDTPADKAIKLLNKILEGQEVTPREALEVRDLIAMGASDLLQPVNFKAQMGAQMGQALDEEVGQSLIDMLMANKGIQAWELSEYEEPGEVTSQMLGSVDGAGLDGDEEGSECMSIMSLRFSQHRTPRVSTDTGDGSGSGRSAGVAHQLLVSEFRNELRQQKSGLGNTSSSSLVGMTGGTSSILATAMAQASGSAQALPIVNLAAGRASNTGPTVQQAPSPQPATAAGVRGLLDIYRNPTDAVTAAMSHADEWGWDPFALAEATGGKPLSALCYALLKRHHGDALKAAGVDEVRLCRFLIRVEELYPDNPYHNRTHAADVVHSMHTIFTRGGLQRALHVGEPGTLAVYLAACVHDVGHKGLNNDFLVRSGDSLALLYNDASPMENHHLATTFQLLAQEPYNFLARAAPKVKETVRRLVISMVLATDMKQHFTQMSLFKAKCHAVDEGPSDMGSPRTSHSGDSLSTTLSPMLLADDEIKTLVLAVGLKCADLGHLAAPRAVHGRWVSLLEEELFRQGDLEKAKSLAVSALMDRTRGGITKSQTGFFNIVALPLYSAFCKVFPGCRPQLDAVTENYEMWREEEEREKAAEHGTGGMGSRAMAIKRGTGSVGSPAVVGSPVANKSIK
eukprot:CAMPEP_0202862862 /NCGR_PEP_ID=MMETSP1391-20130828/3738_1 /ASSEMBLY_ACC=CAM_ASM_000867 /TAXON_ID=1034604 /ORGANISM="Chlamydomonas leiostraca, Strain SAG 11-49" /LENGTH=1034 /DNA_ID=CAMNT_0049542445 /DNA_START=106 /DNA_END=3210 /DNA_ORIENTATION=+